MIPLLLSALPLAALIAIGCGGKKKDPAAAGAAAPAAGGAAPPGAAPAGGEKTSENKTALDGMSQTGATGGTQA